MADIYINKGSTTSQPFNNRRPTQQPVNQPVTRRRPLRVQQNTVVTRQRPSRIQQNEVVTRQRPLRIQQNEVVTRQRPSRIQQNTVVTRQRPARVESQQTYDYHNRVQQPSTITKQRPVQQPAQQDYDYHNRIPVEAQQPYRYNNVVTRQRPTQQPYQYVQPYESQRVVQQPYQYNNTETKIRTIQQPYQYNNVETRTRPARVPVNQAEDRQRPVNQPYTYHGRIQATQQETVTRQRPGSNAGLGPIFLNGANIHFIRGAIAYGIAVRASYSQAQAGNLVDFAPATPGFLQPHQYILNRTLDNYVQPAVQRSQGSIFAKEGTTNTQGIISGDGWRYTMFVRNNGLEAGQTTDIPTPPSPYDVRSPVPAPLGSQNLYAEHNQPHTWGVSSQRPQKQVQAQFQAATNFIGDTYGDNYSTNPSHNPSPQLNSPFTQAVGTQYPVPSQAQVFLTGNSIGQLTNPQVPARAGKNTIFSWAGSVQEQVTFNQLPQNNPGDDLPDPQLYGGLFYRKRNKNVASQATLNYRLALNKPVDPYQSPYTYQNAVQIQQPAQIPAVTVVQQTYTYHNRVQENTQQPYTYHNRVTRTRPAEQPYQYHNQVTRTRPAQQTYTYHNRVERTADVQQPYTYHNRVTRTKTIRVQQLQTVTRPKEIRNNVQQNYQYHVRVRANEVVERTRPVRTDSQQPYQYHHRVRANSQQPYQYHNRVQVNSQQPYQYHNRVQVNSQQPYQYHHRVRTNSQQTYTYHNRIQQTVQQPFPDVRQIGPLAKVKKIYVHSPQGSLQEVEKIYVHDDQGNLKLAHQTVPVAQLTDPN